MTPSLLDLRDCLIVYGADGRAAPARGFGALATAEGGHLLGVVDFSDAASVHADHWEYHPEGDEILCVLEGRLRASVERSGASDDVVVAAGQALIVPGGCWHRLQVIEPGRLVFFTPTAGSQLRSHATGEIRRIDA